MQFLIACLFAAPIALVPHSSLAANVLNYPFSLGDVSRNCEAVRFGEDMLLECSGKDMRIVEELCEVEMRDEESGYLYCQGLELSEIEHNCDVEMYDENVGDILC